MKRLALLALMLLVAACTDDPATPAESGGKAAGEVLGGDISDAMIPLEQLTSQAPLAPRAAQSAADLDAEQPDVSSEEAEAAPAAPAPEIAPAE
ncbi:MAG: hypothetical protein CVT75_05290 [Alphaproteobacteria bacterium HGW-Alphaproteobacteria-14]|nr:MAG: hypothetical protein CVT75_05290 [Alphaproteobacteria bacterium HGW-Alphaproteobacteria-14]